jgi:hypothetical protein
VRVIELNKLINKASAIAAKQNECVDGIAISRMRETEKFTMRYKGSELEYAPSEIHLLADET